ncbi:hypothetical protein GGR56DRAFT_425491 [Xylariaceae sp. FL0804]|nr:hypothetical protein GGR56DRAFT_425491 [Xylariaceae sp. FL0804]
MNTQLWNKSATTAFSFCFSIFALSKRTGYRLYDFTDDFTYDFTYDLTYDFSHDFTCYRCLTEPPKLPSSPTSP